MEIEITTHRFTYKIIEIERSELTMKSVKNMHLSFLEKLEWKVFAERERCEEERRGEGGAEEAARQVKVGGVYD